MGKWNCSATGGVTSNVVQQSNLFFYENIFLLFNKISKNTLTHSFPMHPFSTPGNIRKP